MCMCVLKMFMSKIESKPSLVESLNIEHLVNIFKSQTVFISRKWSEIPASNIN